MIGCGWGVVAGGGWGVVTGMGPAVDWERGESVPSAAKLDCWAKSSALTWSRMTSRNPAMEPASNGLCVAGGELGWAEPVPEPEAAVDARVEGRVDRRAEVAALPFR